MTNFKEFSGVCILAVVLFITIVIAQPVQEISQVGREGASYKTRTYSNQGPVSDVFAYPNTHINTGNIVDDLIEVAYGQVGYYRQEDTNTKYGIWYGYPEDAWCAMFVSWCANQAGVSEAVINPFFRCANEVEWFKDIDRWREPEEYVPKAGDIIFFNYNSKVANHVGIVTLTDDSQIYCIEGNNDDAVNVTIHAADAPYIYGYGIPDYEAAAPAKAQAADGSVYRMYNPDTGEHFFTTWITEKKELAKNGWTGEGVAWLSAPGGNPVYRFYNPNSGDHHFTGDSAEAAALVMIGWRNEGIAWYDGGEKAVYRLYNPNAVTGTHFYTSSEMERDYLVNLGWINEGVGWYGN
ncbi:MAG: CHAP domain-containing protein [Lachnospiraceae bacterium]|nr:CHAP domain-containing protein [Lachnospiraceae bacterium]